MPTRPANRLRRVVTLHCAMRVVWLLALGPVMASARSQPSRAASSAWTLVWSDEFNGAAGAPVDGRRWTHDMGDGCRAGICGWGNEEREYYTSASENVALDGHGRLAITARTAPAGLHCHYGPCRYTSARIKTKGRMNARPGRVEARLRVPSGQGLWPAFWMLGSSYPETPWPQCGELDIMEHRGSKPHAMSSAIHGPGYFGRTPFAHEHVLQRGGFADDFHVFAVEWSSTQVRFLVDGSPHYTINRSAVERAGSWVFDQPFFVILNLAIGGTFDGDPQSDAMLPATMLVDYVRVYVPSAPGSRR